MALLDHLTRPNSHRLVHRLRGCPHPALAKTLVCLRVDLAGNIGAQKPWLTAANSTQRNPRQVTASKVASPSLATTLTSHSSIGLKLLRRPSARCLTRS